MNCKAQVSLEFLVLLLGFLVFVGVLVQAQIGSFELPELELEFSEPSLAFGKSRNVESNFTRWFR
ncbi:hypothetical protein K8R43_01140 [archaeon]|nr:hypothetical protein [archaeon]